MIAKRFSGPALLTNAAATKYTVPAGRIAVIRQIHVSNPTANSVNFTMSIGADAAGTRIYDVFPVAAGAVLDVGCYYPLAAAELVQAFASTTNVLTLTLNGDEDLVS